MGQKGIWQYHDLLKPHVKPGNRLTSKEGNTPLENHPDLAKDLELKHLYIKREDLNPTGSHKDRGLAYQISAHIQEGKENFSISSSGNAAISAINILKNTNFPLHVFLSEKISKEKLKRLTEILDNKVSNELFCKKDCSFENINFYFTQKPLSKEIQYSKKNNTTSLRGSVDPYGWQGFKTIACEIEGDFDTIFIPTSSGNTTKGIYEGLSLKRPIHIVQTTKVNTIARSFDSDFLPTKTSKAKSIVDRIGHRAKEIEKIINDSNGHGWVISNKEIDESQALLRKNNLSTSNESALTIAGIIKAKRKGWSLSKPLCIFTGIT